MDSFTYYFDIKFLPATFDSYFSEPPPVVQKDCKDKPTPRCESRKTTIMEASNLEFKRTKNNNRSQPNRRRKTNKRK
jgi:hypothetical protein